MITSLATIHASYWAERTCLSLIFSKPCRLSSGRPSCGNVPYSYSKPCPGAPQRSSVARSWTTVSHFGRRQPSDLFGN